MTYVHLANRSNSQIMESHRHLSKPRPLFQYTLENTKGHSKMDNPEKLATSGTQDEDKQNKNTTQHVIDSNIRKQKQKTRISLK